ncbi:dethiobiotin synthase [Natronobacterium gregoryi]|uniref:ATP-dependent dethiobiotin synthetase BioD n=2 Tax=Natronobacterium gregoryi TaxID=44930 RepID=L0AIW0_NATGS|nr:dethiobiotin synthase [Natronobacterium gregoryi]AFZ73384.1 dethiobiotin synthase [Natronobacterium gregoryi SP2]ELY68580.1 dethiobiotin synthase [Natronobacterium gregoryi SP2]PLK19664.1 dethiobiotin synthase [Natronobacterium gregoryi SP2]SFI73552.1 dethiobiotin synthetase [Natronobacterium gregoryi]
MTDPVDPGTGVFVAGTGTGVGKTVVTAGLTGWLRSEGVAAHAIKPAQTGAPEDDDAGTVADVCDEPTASTCLRRLEPPLAPRVAASVTDESLSYDDIVAGCRSLAADETVTIVEGIGGVRVPLADGYEVLDLAADLGFPAIVVARSGLGTLNHTALTVAALENRGLSVAGIVLNEYEGETLAERTNPAELERMTATRVATVPPLEVDDGGAVVDGVRQNVPSSLLPVALE